MSQAVWRWLWDLKREIPKEHRSMLMLIYQRILYVSTVQEAEEAYKNSAGYVGFYLPTYENWNEYLENYWKGKEQQCLAFRNEKVRGTIQTNFRKYACEFLNVKSFVVSTHITF
ncbi:hypothetical protein AVEN_258644-1 [Araneus ventricosus]|uniref:Uncharacterized protein n=1 Tax=Araneus ventricosus TaxID=182803 RepID=A0A4Y2JI24_ARAVE|nr:hypothetical protein AVEN_258644-1 [Araneus ventricosus]